MSSSVYALSVAQDPVAQDPVAQEPVAQEPVEDIHSILGLYFPKDIVTLIEWVNHEENTRNFKLLVNAKICQISRYHSNQYCRDCGQLRDMIYDGSQFRIACQGFGSFGRHRPCREVKYTVCDCIICSACKWGVCNKKHRWCENCNGVKSILDR
jgi:hypothetical protein